MKAIMTLIVTLTLGAFSLHASTAETKSDFTVTQLALDAQTASEMEALPMQASVAEDKNESQEDTPEGEHPDSN